MGDGKKHADRVAEARASRLKNIPISMQGIYRRAMAGRSRATAVKAFCQECTGYMVRFVRDCTDLGCPLYPYRPYRTGNPEEGEE